MQVYYANGDIETYELGSKPVNDGTVQEVSFSMKELEVLADAPAENLKVLLGNSIPGKWSNSPINLEEAVYRVREMEIEKEDALKMKPGQVVFVDDEEIRDIKRKTELLVEEPPVLSNTDQEERLNYRFLLVNQRLGVLEKKVDMLIDEESETGEGMPAWKRVLEECGEL